jgi:Fe2+ transport system protein FeoA
MTLCECEAGQVGRVIRVNGGGAEAQRLSEMGMVEGARIRLVRPAPFGDPLQVEILGYRLTVRKREARRVDVEIEE